MQGEGGFTDLGVIGEKAPLAPDHDQTAKYRTPSTAGPTLTRMSLHRNSLAQQPSSGNSSPNASTRPALARVSAQQFPNLSRASQLGLEKRSAAGGALHRSSVAKAQAEMSRRSAIPVSLGVTVGLRDATSGGGVTFKVDGARFATSQHTIKLVQGHTYEFSISVSEAALALDDATAMLSFLNASNTIVKEPLECKRKDRTYTGEWACTCGVSKKGARSLVELQLPIEGFGTCILPLNAKVYPAAKKKAIGSGSPLKSVILQFSNGASGVKMKSEQWLEE